MILYRYFAREVYGSLITVALLILVAILQRRPEATLPRRCCFR
jgi:hypothetical protein